MRLAAKPLKTFERWVLRGYCTRPLSLEAVRILFAGYVLLVGTHDFSWAASVPDALHHPPPGIMSLFDGFPSEGYFWCLRAATVFSAVCLLLGVASFPTSILLSALLVLSYGAAYSVGKITHNILYVATPFVMAWTLGGSASQPSTLLADRCLCLRVGIPDVDGRLAEVVIRLVKTRQ